MYNRHGYEALLYVKSSYEVSNADNWKTWTWQLMLFQIEQVIGKLISETSASAISCATIVTGQCYNSSQAAQDAGEEFASRLGISITKRVTL